ncbi:biotin-dependent carboxyltransferase family protein [Gramella sp. GC03-9]|uniref:Biotin-dependent carboxyltransferase family protein n=1 Tax=Christiangramia oceanisediminis TaxID=2920386 RepID=A0A9X2KWS0_9FLAO|nr:biotin-dependent carboxyltransferase family protein [Gramella oceanisediminis]MCP9199799.1 biotin-dependent carboxyltransferase family protein [Gramella oceanisediminis]
MKAEMEVLQPGLFSSIQDLGRFGFQKYGVPQSGVMDRYAMRIGNLLLGNLQEASVMEMTFQGPQLKFNSPTRICITGADLSPQLNNEPVENFEPIQVKEGDELKFGRRKRGFRSYLAIEGGFDTGEVMGSQSWYEGITSEFRLKKGMRLAYSAEQVSEIDTHSSIRIDMDYLEDGEIEVYPGPEFELLPQTHRTRLFNADFGIEDSSNRMAVQLKETLQNELEPITTGPVLPGTIQLTPSGKMIILMRDCQTTGGYPRILQLSETGIQALAQKMPGERISLKNINYTHNGAK